MSSDRIVVQMKHVVVSGVVAMLCGCTKPNPNYCADHPNKDCALDASTGDGDGDADDGHVATGEVTLDVLLGGVAASGRIVVFHDTDGAITSQTMTDGFGSATGVVGPGAMVTIAVDASNLVTITSIAPGDHIVLKTATPFDASTYGTVAFTATAEASGKSYYRTEVGNSNYTTTANVTSGSDRVFDLKSGNRNASGRIHVVSAAYNSSNQLIAYSARTDLNPTQGGTTNVSLGAWQTDIVNMQVMLSGAPADATQLAMYSANELSGFEFAPSDFGGADQVSVVGGAASVTVPYLGSFGDYVRTRAELRFPAAAKTTFHWARRAIRPAGNFVIASADMPPRLSSVMLDTTDNTRPSAHWTSSGSSGDAIAVRVGWTNSSSGTYAWHAYAPPDATSVVFPMLPTALMSQAPSQTSTFSSLAVTHHDLEPLAGYAAFRVALPVDFSREDEFPTGLTRWVRCRTTN